MEEKCATMRKSRLKCIYIIPKKSLRAHEHLSYKDGLPLGMSSNLEDQNVIHGAFMNDNWVILLDIPSAD